MLQLQEKSCLPQLFPQLLEKVNLVIPEESTLAAEENQHLPRS